MDAFSLDAMRQQLAAQDLSARWAHHFTERLTLDGYLANVIQTVQALVPQAAATGVKLLLHFDDPPGLEC
jgi:D-mannonate dehydratase